MDDVTFWMRHRDDPISGDVTRGWGIPYIGTPLRLIFQGAYNSTHLTTIEFLNYFLK